MVCNLGIESGTIKGECIGAITSHSVGENAKIINCYNNANLEGNRCGGIADNFGDNDIICCWNTGQIKGNVVGDIVSYSAGELLSCYGTNCLTNANNVKIDKNSKIVRKIYKESINKEIDEIRWELDLQKYDLIRWQVD